MWAIVPIKTLDQAKSRLASLLTAEERREVMLALCRDVLTALAQSRLLTGVLIVSRAPEADALAQAFATERFRESKDATLGQALQQASGYLRHHFQCNGDLIVPADLPLLTANAIDALIEGHDRITVVPDKARVGTNALLCSPPGHIEYLFDGRSFRPHVDAAYAAGITPIIARRAELELDIDSPDDLRELLKRGPLTQTGTTLERGGIADRLRSSDNPVNADPSRS